MGPFTVNASVQRGSAKLGASLLAKEGPFLFSPSNFTLLKELINTEIAGELKQLMTQQQ